MDGSQPHPKEGRRDEVSARKSSCWCQCVTSWYLCPREAFRWGVQRSPQGSRMGQSGERLFIRVGSDREMV